MNFQQKLKKIVKKNNSLVCLGLDPEIEKIPSIFRKRRNPLFSFNKEIIDSTYFLVGAYKPNIAFYEAYGLEGLKELKLTMTYLQEKYSEVPVILDAKRGDIGNTAKMYAKAVFEYWNADAVTVYPHLGLDSLLPFFAYKDKLTILLIKTSNPDSKVFQDMKTNGEPYYYALAKKISKWNYKNYGIFVGATYPKELKAIRKLFPDKSMLSAGLGAQKAAIGEAVKAGIDKNGENIVFNASRSILYASSGKDFAKAAQKETKKLKELINSFRR